MKGFQELYIAELQEARSFEAMLRDALPKLAEAASDKRLKTAFREHADATREHEESVEAIVRRLGADPKEHKDQSVQRLVRESSKMADLVEAGPVRDAALIASAQRIEHYEIAVYGTLKAYARTLGFEDDYEILSDILEQEKDTDELLSELAEGIINPTALERELER
jgi:ferritin-like metal-binding protein YciE